MLLTSSILIITISLAIFARYYVYKDINNSKNKPKVFIWESLEKDIPADGSYIQISGTVNDTIYLNNIDE